MLEWLVALMGYLLEVNSIQKFRSDYFLHKSPHSISSSSAKETPFNQKKMNVWGGGLKMFGWGLLCFLLRNVIQENIEIIYFDWCMTKIPQSFTGYIFLSCKHLFLFFCFCCFFLLKILNSKPYFFYNELKKISSRSLTLKGILGDSHSSDFFSSLYKSLFRISYCKVC